MLWVLLDECVDEQLRHHLPGHECQTARYAGFAGLENGDLLTPDGRRKLLRSDIPYSQRHSLSVDTLLDWALRYRRGGFAALAKQPRHDRGPSPHSWPS